MIAMTPEQVAAGLSEAQRAAVLKLPTHGGYLWRGDIIIRKPTANVLSGLGVFCGGVDYWREFTSFGLAVRAILKSQEASNDQ